MQVDMGMEIMAACKGMTYAEMYKEVDTHMAPADSTNHNKQIASMMAEMHSLKTRAVPQTTDHRAASRPVRRRLTLRCGSQRRRCWPERTERILTGSDQHRTGNSKIHERA